MKYECRHGRQFGNCEQCQWEIYQMSKRFDEHVARNLRLEREAIEKRIKELNDGRDLS